MSNPLYLEYTYKNDSIPRKYGCSVDADTLGSRHGTKQASGMKSYFLYELGFTPMYQNPGDYCCLFIIEPRDCSVIAGIPISKLQNCIQTKITDNTDFHEILNEIIGGFENSEYFERCVCLATPVEGAFRSLEMEYEKLLRIACHCNDAAIEGFVKVSGIRGFDTKEMKKALKRLYHNIISNNVMTTDELTATGGQTPTFLRMFGFLS